MAELQRNFHVLHRCGNIGNEFIPLKEKNIMLTNQPQYETMLPPGVNAGELTVNQILKEWEGVEMVPMAITELRLNQRGKEKSHNDDEGDLMLPPGVE